ncbi:hypothetical protein SprV_0100291600 [Sparganum proliferum]
MRNIRATPPRASPANSFIPPDLDTCNFVWVRHDAVRRPLQPPYDGPYRVLRRSDKDVVIDRNGKTDTVSIDRVKPVYIDDSDHSSPQHCTPPQTVRPPPPTGNRPSPVRRTRSGRHVHWPDRQSKQHTLQAPPPHPYRISLTPTAITTATISEQIPGVLSSPNAIASNADSIPTCRH